MFLSLAIIHPFYQLKSNIKQNNFSHAFYFYRISFALTILQCFFFFFRLSRDFGLVDLSAFVRITTLPPGVLGLSSGFSFSALWDDGMQSTDSSSMGCVSGTFTMYVLSMLTSFAELVVLSGSASFLCRITLGVISWMTRIVGFKVRLQ